MHIVKNVRKQENVWITSITTIILIKTVEAAGAGAVSRSADL
jgi:hypothetical protein